MHGTKCARLIIKHYVCEPTTYIFSINYLH
ncbi:hypothetical protein F383_24711 [Gossypium arboreum]|uniref:Uncharacterized protein n=1 Tax=Gossypium arboreum TaxID=29729 RepID=A0A0B0P309_GOSAR|nr:hypothetical protein F383_24711 [Gossypium arboreum]